MGESLICICEEDLVELLAARRPEVEVGSMPFEVRKHFGCSRDTVFLTTDSIRHIVKKHGDHVALKELLLLPQVLAKGLWLADHRPTYSVITCELDGVRYKSVVKVTRDRKRSYATTFHRTARRQTKALIKKGKPLRLAW